jgi:glycosyltransferase involved in cell wall biosynthesis
LKKKILFVGSFLEKANDGSVGGQMYACRSLLESTLSNEVNWILLDTTGKTVPPPSIYRRAFGALLRIFKFLYLLIIHGPSTILVFSASGASFYEKGLMIIFGKIFRTKTILAPRGGPLIDEISKSKVTRYYFKFVVSCCNYVICQGSFWKGYFSTLLNNNANSKLVIIPNWINSALYENLKEGIVKRSSNEINILFMGWIQEEKGVNDLFDALLRIDFEGHTVKVNFLGDGSEREKLKKRTASENYKNELCFHFPGWVHGKEKLEYLNKADIFVLPSYSEGMPNSLMEAMAAGIASISSNVGSVPDLIEHQENGILFNPKDINALSEAIKLLVSDQDKRDIFALKSKEKILQNHSINSAVDSFKRIL